ncbi:MAG: threonine-phosphate decarboxylase CobD [Sulfuricellaceae bacterium]
MLEHGGRIGAAARRYGIPADAWLDLSTGINPRPWRVPRIPAAAWARLPEEDDDLEDAARAYYGAPQALPLAGSQAAIQALPSLFPRCRVGVIAPGYLEHAHAWSQAGHEVQTLSAVAPIEAVDNLEVVVLIQPNNPTGDSLSPDRLLDLHARLAARGGCLVVDEAFMDATPERSLAPFSDRPGLVVLRSLGKFFGLAGARVGFALAQADVLERLHERLGPWTVTGASRFVAAQALRDVAWQTATRARLVKDAARLADLLARHGLPPTGGTALFQWVITPTAADLDDFLARRGILARRFDTPSSLRFGLPGKRTEWQRLDVALRAWQAVES